MTGYTFTLCVGYFTSPGIDRRGQRLLVGPYIFRKTLTKWGERNNYCQSSSALAFLLAYWQMMPFGHIRPVRMVACQLMVYQICLNFFIEMTSELLEIVFDGRAFHDRFEPRTRRSPVLRSNPKRYFSSATTLYYSNRRQRHAFTRNVAKVGLDSVSVVSSASAVYCTHSWLSLITVACAV